MVSFPGCERINITLSSGDSQLQQNDTVGVGAVLKFTMEVARITTNVTVIVYINNWKAFTVFPNTCEKHIEEHEFELKDVYHGQHINISAEARCAGNHGIQLEVLPNSINVLPKGNLFNGIYKQTTDSVIKSPTVG